MLSSTRPATGAFAGLAAAGVVSVNVGTPREAPWAALGRTAIHKTPVGGRVPVTRSGLEGDQVGDTVHHGGVDQAVYVFAREDLDVWGERLGREIPDGWFGENLTTRGIDPNAAVMGERWRIGDTLLELCSVRTPCHDFKAWMGVAGYDNAHWVRRFAQEARPGPYLRVLEEGTIAAGDAVEVVFRPDHGVTVAEVFRALMLDRSLLPRLLVIDTLAAGARARAERYVATART